MPSVLRGAMTRRCCRRWLCDRQYGRLRFRLTAAVNGTREHDLRNVGYQGQRSARSDRRRQVSRLTPEPHDEQRFGAADAGRDRDERVLRGSMLCG